MFYKEWKNLEKLSGRFYNNESLSSEDMSAFSNLLSDLRKNVKYIGWRVRDCKRSNATKTLEEFSQLHYKAEDVIDGLMRELNIRHVEEYLKFSDARESKIDIRDSMKKVLNKIKQEKENNLQKP